MQIPILSRKERFKERDRYDTIRPTLGQRIPVWLDIALRAKEIEAMDFVAATAPMHIRELLMQAANKPHLVAADGAHYRDLRTPINTGDHPSVTLAATAKALWVSTEGATALPANYWTVGKHVQLTVFGRMTSAATPGNLTFSINNSTADAGGTAVSSAAVAWTASQTAKTFRAICDIHCRSVSSTGTLMMTGIVHPAVSAIASTLSPMMIPENTPATVTQDTTAVGGITLQALRSGSTAETMQVHELLFESLSA